jgi:hypothetical protein
MMKAPIVAEELRRDAVSRSKAPHLLNATAICAFLRLPEELTLPDQLNHRDQNDIRSILSNI